MDKKDQSDLLERFLRNLPCYEEYGEAGSRAAFYGLDTDRCPKLSKMRHKTPLALAVKVRVSHKGSALPPIESIAFTGQANIVHEKMEFPFGFLLNKVDTILSERCSTQGGKTDGAEDYGALRRLLDTLLEQGTRVNESSTVLEFLKIGYVPRTDPSPCDEGSGSGHCERASDADYFVRCLADVVYYAYTNAPWRREKYGREHGVLKRCECRERGVPCGKIYLSYRKKSKYCYLPRGGVEGPSCQYAMTQRGQGERRKDNTAKSCEELYRKLYERHYKRDGSHSSFMEECEKQKELFANDLARYELMEEWLKDKAETDYIRPPKSDGQFDG